MQYQAILAKALALDHSKFQRNLSGRNTLTQSGKHSDLLSITSPIQLLPSFIAVVLSLVLGSTPLMAEVIPYDEAKLFFELNNTDGDLGIHALIDGDAWRKLKITDPRGRKMLDIRVKGRLKRQGLTEIFFESAEPRFSELDPQDFFDRFPAGEYKITGKTLERRGRLRSEVPLTHVMPAPAVVTVNGEPMAVQCDEEEPGFDATEVSTPVTIAWEAVTMSHPDPVGGGAGAQPPVPVTIHNYEVVLEVEVEVSEEALTSTISVILPPGQTSLTVPAEFIALGTEFKYEVLAREESFNQTAVESCFVL